MSAHVVLPVYTREVNAGTRGNDVIQSNPFQGTAVTARVFEPILWLPARRAKINVSICCIMEYFLPKINLMKSLNEKI